MEHTLDIITIAGMSFLLVAIALFLRVRKWKRKKE